jgi:type III polyketide synthase
MINHSSTNAIYVTGLAHAYPQHSLGPKEFEENIARLYPNHTTSPGYIHTREIEMNSY